MGAKFRILALAVSCLFLLVAFQNCGRVDSLLLAPGQSLAQNEPTSSSSPEPDPMADPPPNTIGTTVPGRTKVPECFTLSQAGENSDGQLVLHAQLFTSSGIVVPVSAGKLLLAGSDSVLEISAAAIYGERGIVEFHVNKEQLASGAISGVFQGVRYNVIIDQCKQ